MSDAIQLTADNFDAEVVKSEVPVLVDFWAPWCGPCKMLIPTIDALVGEFEGRAKIAKMNVDDHGELAQQFGIRSIPTMIVFKNGEIASTMIGVKSQQEIAAEIEKML
jgi:thioredoxin 1